MNNVTNNITLPCRWTCTSYLDSVFYPNAEERESAMILFLNAPCFCTAGMSVMKQFVEFVEFVIQKLAHSVSSSKLVASKLFVNSHWLSNLVR